MRESFTERMAQGRELAQDARNRGQHTGGSAKGWNVKRSELVGLDAIEAYYHQFRTDISYNAYLAVEWELFGHEWEGIEI
jgi:hypothetical protein